jgi:hypothetical protein
MAIKKSTDSKIKRPNVHAKTKSSVSKNAKNYIKKNIGQGK